MKKLSFSLLVIGSVCALSTTKAQSNCSGVFLTANDLSTGKLYYTYTGKNGSTSSDYDLLTKKKIIINQSGSINQVDKKNIYAVKDCNGKIIRIYKGGYYTLLNPEANMPIYMVTQNPASKGDIAINKYYFSKNSNSEIKELTIDNLEAEFPDFHQFNDAMKAIYKTDKELFASVYADNNLPKTSSIYIKSDEK
jgi:hypothetical protein